MRRGTGVGFHEDLGFSYRGNGCRNMSVHSRFGWGLTMFDSADECERGSR